jgi:hypothetical protein
VPKQVALAHTIPPVAAVPKARPEAPKPWYQRNLEAWRNFFVHSQAPKTS